MVTKLGVPNAQQHLAGLFPGGFALCSAYVAPSQLQQLDAAVDEALEAGIWVDCLPLVPPVLSTADAVDLLSRASTAQQLGRGLPVSANSAHITLPVHGTCGTHCIQA